MLVHAGAHPQQSLFPHPSVPCVRPRIFHLFTGKVRVDAELDEGDLPVVGGLPCLETS